MGSFPVAQSGSADAGDLAGPATIRADSRWPSSLRGAEAQAQQPGDVTRIGPTGGSMDTFVSAEKWPLGKMFQRREGPGKGASKATPERAGTQGPRHRRHGSNAEILNEVDLPAWVGHHKSVLLASGRTGHHARSLSVGSQAAQDSDITYLAEAAVARSDRAGRRQAQQDPCEQAPPLQSAAKAPEQAGPMELGERGDHARQWPRTRPTPQQRLDEHLARTGLGGEGDSSRRATRLHARRGPLKGSPPLPPSRSTLRSMHSACDVPFLVHSKSEPPAGLDLATRLSSDSSSDGEEYDAEEQGKDPRALHVSSSDSQPELSLNCWEGSLRTGRTVHPRPSQGLGTQGVNSAVSWPGDNASQNDSHGGSDVASSPDVPPLDRELSLSTSSLARQDKSTWGLEPSGALEDPHLRMLPQASSMEATSWAGASLAPSLTQTGQAAELPQQRLPGKHCAGAGSGRTTRQGLASRTGEPAPEYQEHNASFPSPPSKNTGYGTASKGTAHIRGSMQEAQAAGHAGLAGSTQPGDSGAVENLEQWLSGRTMKMALNALKRESRLERRGSWEAEDILKAWAGPTEDVEEWVGVPQGGVDGGNIVHDDNRAVGSMGAFESGPSHKRAPSWNAYSAGLPLLDAPGVVWNRESSLGGLQSALGRLPVEEEAALWADEEEGGAGDGKGGEKANGKTRGKSMRKLLRSATKRLAGFSRSETMDRRPGDRKKQAGGSSPMEDRSSNARPPLGPAINGGQGGLSPGSQVAIKVPRCATAPSLPAEGHISGKASPRTVQVTFPWKEGNLPSPERPAAPLVRFNCVDPSE